MQEEGTLSIVRRGATYQVRYASYRPYDCDYLPYVCPDEDTLVAWLQQWGIQGWALQQARATLQKGSVAVLPVVCSVVQRETAFPLHEAPRRPGQEEDRGRPTSSAVPNAATSCHGAGTSAAPAMGRVGRSRE
jgi:hypothetical protein